MTWVIHCYAVLAIVSNSYPPLQGRLPTRYSPVRNSSKKSKLLSSAFYLHVLGTPPAFVLSQDQTLLFNLDSLILLIVRFPFGINFVVQNMIFCLVLTSRSSHHYALFKELFPASVTPGHNRLAYNIKLTPFCQLFFSLFFSRFEWYPLVFRLTIYSPKNKKRGISPLI